MVFSLVASTWRYQQAGSPGRARIAYDDVESLLSGDVTARRSGVLGDLSAIYWRATDCGFFRFLREEQPTLSAGQLAALKKLFSIVLIVFIACISLGERRFPEGVSRFVIGRSWVRIPSLAPDVSY